MKNRFTFFLTVLLACCKTVDPLETKATIVTFADSAAPCYGGYILETETGETYHTQDVPEPFRDIKKLPIKIWTAFERVQTGDCSRVTQRVTIKSMRRRTE